MTHGKPSENGAPVPRAVSYLDGGSATRQLHNLAEDFAVIRKDSGPFPPFEVVPLAPKRTMLDDGLAVALMDMDGTTTSTEDVCCLAMEEMMRRMSGLAAEAWPGLDRDRDHPALIGYSGRENLEYLGEKYGHLFSLDATTRAYIEAAAWNIGPWADPAQAANVRDWLAGLGLAALLNDPRFRVLMRSGKEPAAHGGVLDALCAECIGALRAAWPACATDVGLTIYAHDYHRRLVGNDEPMIRPLPGVGVVMAALKGRLGADAACCFDMLAAALDDVVNADEGRDTLRALGVHFERQPARLALVTTSSAFETRHVLRHVFTRLRAEIMDWGLPPERSDAVHELFQTAETSYDAVVTSTDIPETRLKPFRDPYSAALARLGVDAAALARVVGFEDTEPGVISLRAAGVPVAVALPLEGTRAHDFQAASHVATRGFPEILLRHRLFLSERALEDAAD
ncbi:MAG TPA: hypothetical protein PKI11_05570 [Candidatus Hydrogenedentes bacterium]|nr:hypothetical protein [Candidatus Hydrogenedentota bacterium]